MGEIPLARPSDDGCSVEIWLRPARASASATLLAFHDSGQVKLALHQSLTDLAVERESAGNPFPWRSPLLYASRAFAEARPVFFSISSGANGTAIYVDGVLTRSSPSFWISPRDCDGRLTLGASPTNGNAWSGIVKGLAIYHRELTGAQALRHYQTWAAEGFPVLADGETCAALYLFSERAGAVAHNRAGERGDLLIPERYQVEDQALLTPFWREFRPSWSYVLDLVKNVVGFVPLGFVFCAWLRRTLSSSRAAWVTTILGMLVSVTIEVLQAYLPTRQSGMTDILTNTLGTWLGVVAWRRAPRVLRWGL